MKITKIKKNKNGLYEITFDNQEKINLYDDIILKYELLYKKDISDNDLKDIIKDNSYIEAYHQALKFISIKLRTTKEIEKKLINYSKDVVVYVINRLKKEGYLNNDLYIKAYTNDCINLKLIGSNKIMFELKKLGFKEEEIANYLETIPSDIWLEKIKKYVAKKINANHNLSSIVLKQKIIQELKNKGFLMEDINNILNDITIMDDSKIYEKEYSKIKKKLEQKYSGDELEYKIKIALYRKGFRQ